MNAKTSSSLILAVLAATLPGRSVGRAADLGSATHEVRIDALTFTLPSHLRIERIAADPLVRWPIVADWDPQGRLVVAESGGVAKPIEEHNKQKLHRIIRLHDSDGDGHFDQRIVAADALAFPEGVLCIGNAILVSAPPQIWKLTDQDGDGVCEDREVWFDGQTITGCANDLHGPYLGRDGWIYWCKGAFAKQTHELINGQRHESSAAHIYRRRLSGGPIEPVMTGGMDNPVEVAFTPVGERFFTSTFLQHPGDGRRDGIVHAIYGGVYGKQQKAIVGHRRTGDLMPIMTHLGPAAPSGLTCLESTALLGSSGLSSGDACYLAAAQFNLQKVSLHELRPHGATFQTTDQVLVKGSRIDFHPTDVLEDADGSLLVIDTGGWYNLCCPSSKLDQTTAAGGIYRIRSVASETAIDARGEGIQWNALSADQAVQLLGDKRPWVRARASEWCIRSPEMAGISLCASLLDETLPDQHRIEAIWTALQIGDDDSMQSIVTALQSPRPAIRQTAAHAISVERHMPARRPLEELLVREKSAAVKRAAAEALGRVGNADSVGPLLTALASVESDRVLQHSLLYALIELNQPQQLVPLLASSSAHEVLAALVVLDQLQAFDSSHADQIFALLQSADSQTRDAALNVLCAHPKWAASATKRLDAAFDQAIDDDMAALRAIAAAWQYDAGFQQWVGKRLQSLLSLSTDRRAQLLSLITAFGSESVPKQWDATIAAWLRSADDPSLARLSDWMSSWGGPRFQSSPISSALLDLANDPRRSTGSRLQLLAALPSPLLPSSENMSLMVSEFLAPESEHQQLANQALLRTILDAAHAQQLVQALDRVEASQLITVVISVNRVNDDPLDRNLISRLAEVPAGKTLSPETLRNLYRKRSVAVRQALEDALTTIQQPTEAVAAELDAVLATLPQGDAVRGFELFRSERTACHACHRIAFVGGTVGPELSHIGASRTRRDLLEAILFPSSRLEQSYQPTRVLTADGVVHNGMIVSETDRVLELALDATRVVSIDKDAIDERQASDVSIMPAGLAELLNRSELADLLAFLESAK